MKSKTEIANFTSSEDKTPLLGKERKNKNPINGEKPPSSRRCSNLQGIFSLLCDPWNMNPKEKRIIRRMLITWRCGINDIALLLAFIGIVLMLWDTEYFMKESGDYQTASIVLRSCITGTTIILLLTLILYHAVDVRLYMIKNSMMSRHLVLNGKRMISIAVEIIVCAIHVPPGKQ